jgi:hypothetical protein
MNPSSFSMSNDLSNIQATHQLKSPTPVEDTTYTYMKPRPPTTTLDDTVPLWRKKCDSGEYCPTQP